MYKTFDYVVYKHDVCKIKDIKEEKLTGKKYYVMTPIDDESLMINIPTDSKLNFLRNVISKEEAEDLIKNISNIPLLEDINDKNISIKYKELLKSHKLEDLVKIIKTTYIRNENRINNNKKISEKDDNFFKLAEKYLYNELSISLNKSIEDVKKYIVEKVNN